MPANVISTLVAVESSVRRLSLKSLPLTQLASGTRTLSANSLQYKAALIYQPLD